MNESGSDSPPPAPFKYHVELTPAQLKITYTALHSLLDDFGHEEADVVAVIKEVLEKLPDAHAIRAIQLDREIAEKIAGRPGTDEAATPGDDSSPSAA
jgi:hypothetical protein